MDLKQILSKKHYRRSFIIIFGVSLMLLIGIRHLVLPLFDSSLRISFIQVIGSLIDGLAVSLIITVVLSTFILWITPDVMSLSRMDVIEPREIRELLEQAMLKTEHWWYKGGCGRYFRAKTLPEIAKNARIKSAFKEIIVLILDPTNDDLCAKYATYRRSLGSASQDQPWTKERVRNEIYATILETIITKHREPLLRIDLGLTNYFSSFRFDLSSKYVIVTKEDKLAPAMRCDRGTYFYQSYRDEIMLAYNQARKINQLSNIPPLSVSQLNSEKVEKLFLEMGLDNQGMNEQDFDEVLNLAKNSKNPYV